MAAPKEVDKVTRQEIVGRIAPVGEVCIEGQPCATAAPVAQASDGPRSGEKIYNSYCTACHTAGVLGAPKKDDANAWSQKLAAAGSYSTLLSNAVKGIGSMPPKGTCMDCSDEEISIAIEYMSGLKP
nr:c-type cytochrome [Sansalvadorimonas sp. 2012CJ34-2]